MSSLNLLDKRSTDLNLFLIKPISFFTMKNQILVVLFLHYDPWFMEKAMQLPQDDLTPWRLTLPVMPTRHPAPRAAHIAHLFRNCCSNNDDILNIFCLFQFIVGFCFQSKFFDTFIWQKKFGVLNFLLNFWHLRWKSVVRWNLTKNFDFSQIVPLYLSC